VGNCRTGTKDRAEIRPCTGNHADKACSDKTGVRQGARLQGDGGYKKVINNLTTEINTITIIDFKLKSYEKFDV
jgi:hypothetical protein